MHVHMKPISPAQTAASQPVKPAKAKPAGGGTDVHALLALSGDRRGGSGSQPRHPPQREEDADKEREPARMQPAMSLAVLLTEMDLDRTS